ncbi:MAG: hypothetical protein MEQ07_08505 [Aquimonas sp.]|nr:hypothetical protein [Aquimonas sp.]
MRARSASLRHPACCALLLALLTTPVPAAAVEDTRSLREAVQLGRLAPLERILEDALRRVPGRVVKVELDAEDDEYEIEILDALGRVWELEYRASSGELKSKERD